MKKFRYGMYALILLTMASCQGPKQPENPFFSEYTTPFQVPHFDKIDTTHFVPAFIEGMKQQQAEIEAIVNSKEVPTFDNTVLALDKSGKLLTKVGRVFFNLKESTTNDQLQMIAIEISPLMSKHGDDISMNPGLFAKIKAVFEKRNESGLDAQQIRVVEKYYNDFVRQGANLSAGQQDEMRKINEQLSMLTINFGQNLLEETNQNYQLVIDNKDDLAGLPEWVITTAAETAKAAGKEGKWVFTLSKTSWIPFLQYSEKRALREQIYRAWFMRGNNDNKNDNKKILAQMVKLRADKARLLGYANYASYVLEENMAKTTQNADAFLKQLMASSLPLAQKELTEMQAIADAEGAGFKLESWDWWYYAEKLHISKYNLDENELKPYLSLANVRDGMFAVAGKLYGITFNKLTNLPVYQKDVETYEVKEADGSHLGILYLDYYPRDNKGGGAWCTDFQSAGWENGKRVDPIVSIVCNFTPPTADAPALLNWDETLTLFHEFGHSLHAMFTTGKYSRTAGVVPQDYVELPSQIMENWAGEPEVLRMFAKHYKTGEVIPEALITKIQNSGLFNQGFQTVEYVAASILDLDFHKLSTSTDNLDVVAFEKASMDSIQLMKEIIPRYRSTYFAHIFDGGYAAGYYVYIWAAVLDADAFDYFKKSGDLFNPTIAASFRKNCLSECGSDEGMVQYIKFRGQEPSQASLLERRGLK